jgi:hypothetical protein
MTLDRREVVSIDVPVSLTTLWAHLRDPKLIRRWYRSERPSLGDEIEATFIRQPRESIDADAARVEHRLIWPHGDVLTIAAENHRPDRCHVSFTRASYQGLHSNTYDGVWDVIDELWVASLHQLAFAVTAHLDEERRTLTVERLDAGVRGDRLLDRAGLSGARGVPVGAHVEGIRPDGTRLGGTLVYKTPHQFGLALHGIGEHMLVVYEVPVGERPPNGEVGAVLSTWGLDDARFDQVRVSWEAWWRRSRAAKQPV